MLLCSDWEWIPEVSIRCYFHILGGVGGFSQNVDRNI